MVRGDTLNGIVEATAIEKIIEKGLLITMITKMSPPMTTKQLANKCPTRVTPLNKYPTPLSLNFVRSKQMTRKLLFSLIKFETIASLTAM